MARKTKLFSIKGLMPKMDLGISAKDLGFSGSTGFRLKPKRRRKKSIAKLMRDI